MAVFLKNTCQYSSCGRSYFSLTDLIIHIENDHLDFDPKKIEQLEMERPECIPMSYVLKFSESGAAPPQCSSKTEVLPNKTVIHEIDDGGPKQGVSVLNNNYLSDCHDRRAKGETRLSQEFFQMSGNKLFTVDGSHKKPFMCSMKGCEKRYKNLNGIKYHYKKHHEMLIPTLKQTLLKHKSLLTLPKPPFESPDLQGPPLYSYQAPTPAYVYHTQHSAPQLEECEMNEFCYKLSTSDVTGTQVPLPNMSFNYYNVSEVGDIEDFSAKNPAHFGPNF